MRDHIEGQGRTNSIDMVTIDMVFDEKFPSITAEHIIPVAQSELNAPLVLV